MNYSVPGQQSAMSLAAASSSKYTPEQLGALEACYERNSQPSSQEVKALAGETGLTQAQCRAWLQYQRKKRKKNLMEHEREVFRIEIKCLNERIGAVRDQNDKLQQENVSLRKSFEQLREYEQELGDATTTLESKLDPRFLSRSGSGGDGADRGDHSGSGGAGGSASAGAGTSAGEEEDAAGRGSPAPAPPPPPPPQVTLEAAAMTLSGVLTKNVENMADQKLHLPSLVQGGKIAMPMPMPGAAGGDSSAANTPASFPSPSAGKVEGSPTYLPLQPLPPLPLHPLSQEQQSTSTGTLASPATATQADSSEAANSLQLQERFYGRTGSTNLKTEEDMVEGIARNVGKQLVRASAIITHALRNSSRDGFDGGRGGGGDDGDGEEPGSSEGPGGVMQAVVHHQDAVQMRQVLQQRESALSEEILRSIEGILAQGEGKRPDSEGMAGPLSPLLVSYVRTETAIKEQQMLLKSRMLAHLPLGPSPTAAEAGQDRHIQVKCTSMFCIFCQCYLGMAERSLCLMGEPSLYALITHASQYVLPPPQIIPHPTRDKENRDRISRIMKKNRME